MRKLLRSSQRVLKKVSLVSLVVLLLYLTLFPEQRKAIFEKRVLGKDNYQHTEIAATTMSLDIFKSRYESLVQRCTAINVTSIKSPRTILYSKQLRLAYCPLPMTASTPVRYAMMLSEGKRIQSHTLYNISFQQAIHTDAQKLALRSSPQKVNGQADVLLIVRDPWHRLVSAYRKFIEQSKRPSSYAKSCQSLLGVNREITFELFLRCIIKTVSTGGNLAMHLQPAYQLCSVCKIEYTRIGMYIPFAFTSHLVLYLVESCHSLPHYKQ